MVSDASREALDESGPQQSMKWILGISLLLFAAAL